MPMDVGPILRNRGEGERAADVELGLDDVDDAAEEGVEVVGGGLRRELQLRGNLHHPGHLRRLERRPVPLQQAAATAATRTTADRPTDRGSGSSHGHRRPPRLFLAEVAGCPSGICPSL